MSATVPVADRSRCKVFDVGRHFVQQDEDGVFAVEQPDLRLFVRDSRAGGAELFEDVGFGCKA